MRLEAFRTELPRAFDGDLAAPHPRDRRFRALLADVPGMATESKLALLSLAAAHLEPGEAYLEVGSFKGLSLIGAMLGNQHAPFYAIENFLEFNLDSGATRDELLGNLDRWVDRERLRLLEGDCLITWRWAWPSHGWPTARWWWSTTPPGRWSPAPPSATWPPTPATSCCSTSPPSGRRTRAGGTACGCTPSGGRLDR